MGAEMSVHVQVVEPTKWAGVEQIARAIHFKSYRYFRTLPARYLHAYLSRYLMAKSEDADSTVIVARDGYAGVGVVILQDLPWDSEHFRCRCGKLEAFATQSAYSAQREILDALLQAVFRIAQEQEYAFLWTKCDSGFFPLIHALEDKGFRLMDCELTLVHNGVVPLDVDTRYHVEIARNHRVPGLENLGSIFAHSRFHSDPEIPADQADGLWRKSIIGSCEGFADEVIVLYEDTEPIGFVTCKDDKLSGEVFPNKVRSFFLVGVSPACQGQGVGRELMQVALRHSLRQTPLIEVETQSRNQAALALYQKSGFRIAASEYSFHCWL